MDPLFLLWFFVLPLIGMVALIVGPIFWFIIVPKVSRRLTWARFGDKILLALAYDEGTADIQLTKESLPEGVVRVKNGFHFLPRGKHKKTEDLKKYGFLFRKFILKGLGKPIYFAYAGKCGVVNPETLAVTSGVTVPMSNNPVSTVVPKLESMREMIKILPANVSRGTKKAMMAITERTIRELRKPKREVKELTFVDPTKIKELIPTLHTPSQLDVVAMNREMKGMKRAGSQIGKIAIGFGVIVMFALVAIIGIMAVSGGGIFGGGDQKETVELIGASLTTVVRCLF